MNESLLPAQRLAIARNPQRPGITDYIDMLFTDFVELRGDRLCGEDPAILGGVALFHGAPVTVIGTRKGVYSVLFLVYRAFSHIRMIFALMI